MIKEYTKEQIWKLYEGLPNELKEVIFSGDTADNIWSVCERNEVNEVSKVAKYAGYVLMGVLPPDEFQKTLEEEVGLEAQTAKKTTQELNRFIFFPVKNSLEEIYKTEIAQPAEMVKLVRPAETETTLPKREPKETPGEDTYRETVE